MAATQKSESALLKKVWDIANVLSAAGVGFTDYITPLTYVLFLKMADEKEAMGLPTHLPEGCTFAPRCRYATEACKAKRPEVRHVSDTHTVCCSRYDEPDFQIEGWQ